MILNKKLELLLLKKIYKIKKYNIDESFCFLMKEFVAEGMNFYVLRFNIEKKVEHKQVRTLLEDNLYKENQFIISAFYFFVNSEITIILVKKMIVENFAEDNIKVNLSNINENFSGKIFFEKIKLENLAKLFFKLLKNVISHKNSNLSIYLPYNYSENYLNAFRFIDDISLINSENISFRSLIKLSHWVKHYIVATQVCAQTNFIKKMVYLDFCYNDLYINKRGVFYKYKDEGIIKFEYFLSVEDYATTFYSRVRDLKKTMPIEFFGVNFNNLFKDGLLYILNNEMDFFWFPL